MPEDVDTRRRFIEINDRDEDRGAKLVNERASDWIFRGSTSLWFRTNKDLDVKTVTKNVASAKNKLKIQFVQKSTGTVTEKIQQINFAIHFTTVC